MPRAVVTRSPHREVGVVNPGWLLDHSVHHESSLERRFIMVALSCPVVRDIQHQPCEIELTLASGQTCKYTPDFLLSLVDGSEVIVEVKPEKFVPEHAMKLDAAKVAFNRQGREFEVFTDKVIDGSGLSSRAVLLMRFGRMSFSLEQAMKCKEELESRCEGSASVRDLVAAGVNEDLIWNLVALHQLRVPAGLNLSDEEVVSINQHQGDCHVYFRQWFGVA
ncbi:Tn7 transposase TnsA N-terminal domain-containing protein [Hydrogenophaga sp. UC242_50]|uniref:Tn7 transposase TnsA N-terminal domain-containing protein n=1 Tax=unclassified Hydrogenophaga TaxID=2610897 RepID=UPI0036D38758